MDNRAEISEFLRTRRAGITPEQANLPDYGGKRRVPGLRREEVATLAGVSVDYYIKLERGSLAGVSDEVLDAIARALRLDDAEIQHLFDLARAAQPRSAARRRTTARQVRPSLQRFIDAIPDAPVWVRNDRLDFVTANQLGYALFSELFTDPTRPVNAARFTFLNPRAQAFYLDWDQVTGEVVATLRGCATRNPHDRALTDLIGELATRSTEFRTLWAAHNVRHHRTGRKLIHHPVVGDLDLTYEAMELPAEPGLTMFAFTPDPASDTEERLKLLASWAATLTDIDRINQPRVPGEH